MAKFKIEPKCTAVKVTPLTKVALVNIGFKLVAVIVQSTGMPVFMGVPGTSLGRYLNPIAITDTEYA
jgi:hypothetical protein